MRQLFKLASICTFVICDGAAGQSVQFTKTTAVTNSSAVLWTFLKCASPPAPVQNLCASPKVALLLHTLQVKGGAISMHEVPPCAL